MVTIRRATPSDADGLVHLRGLMFDAMGRDGVEDEAWRSQAAAWFAEHLGGDASAFVAETDHGHLVAAALGEVVRGAPSPSRPSGTSGRLSNVVTDPDYRRRGHARACMEQLLAWFREETSVDTVDLFATDKGEELYESLGFKQRPYPAMRFDITR